ncbi:hypothetical protein [Clostridium tarantellae]|uniref:Uncharacterized protein n=1 Tax=Clostridium tarantellae TaxID=39493 RepID=A0A6I1MTS0_9CLOT|nr:hypothetical protein [Clostridium tarantellae]MPQ43629.1 hypothetical protein [Clostridium tarantellae]
MLIIKYLDLDSNYKRKLSGSINNFIKSSISYNNYKSIKTTDIYKEWLDCSTELEDSIRYYLNKGRISKEFALDNELLQDIEALFKVRLEKSVANLQKKIDTEMATEKQINYANKLYKKINGTDGPYKLETYTKAEISVIIQDLLTPNKGTAKVIDFLSYKKDN